MVLACSLEYNTDLYHEETIQRMALHFERLLQQGIEAPDQLLTRLKMVTMEEKAQIDARMKRNMRYFDTEHAIHQII